MRLILLTVWLMALLHVEANKESFVYELIIVYKAYLLDFKVARLSGTPRNIAPNLWNSNLNPDTNLDVYQEFLNECERQGIVGVVPFEQFVHEMVVPGEGLAAFPRDDAYFDPHPDVSTFESHYINTQTNPKLASDLLFPNEPTFVRTPPDLNRPKGRFSLLMRLVTNQAARCHQYMFENAPGTGDGQHDSDFWKATYDKYERTLNIASLVRQKHNMPGIEGNIEELLNDPAFKEATTQMTDLSERRIVLDIPAYDASKSVVSFPALDTRAFTEWLVPSQENDLRKTFYNWITSLGTLNRNDHPRTYRGQWEHGNIINTMNNAYTRFKMSVARCAS